jgi:hypothetical protein
MVGFGIVARYNVGPLGCGFQMSKFEVWCEELTVMWLLSQYCSQHCGVYTYILATVELSSLSITDNRHRPFCPLLLLFQVHNYLPLAHNLNIWKRKN